MRSRAAVLSSFLLLFTACADREPVAPPFTAEPAASRQVTGPAVVQGEIGPGALYALFIPAGWNGDLVLYAHGYRLAGSPITLPVIDPLRDGLLNMGFGVAYSSYSENGLAIKDGVTRTRQLRGLFASNFGPPKDTYIMGHSMGGLITLMAAEQNPGLFAGALPMCGLMGGTRVETDYFFHVRVLFDVFYPGVIPGSAIHPPDDLEFGALQPALLAALVANPLGAVQIAAVQQIPYNNGTELFTSILTALFFNIEAFGDVVARSHGHNPFDNRNTWYAGSFDDVALNAAVARFDADPAAVQHLDNWYRPHGNLKIPMLTLHTTRDPQVPAFHQPVYAGVVAAAGASSHLVQRLFDRYGHCTFTLAEQLGAFAELVTWARTGVAPVP